MRKRCYHTIRSTNTSVVLLLDSLKACFEGDSNVNIDSWECIYVIGPFCSYITCVCFLTLVCAVCTYMCVYVCVGMCACVYIHVDVGVYMCTCACVLCVCVSTCGCGVLPVVRLTGIRLTKVTLHTYLYIHILYTYTVYYTLKVYYIISSVHTCIRML